MGDFRLESGERLVPELVEPFPERAEAIGVDVVHAARPLGAIRHQTRQLQDLEMLRDGRPADGHVARDLADRARPGAQVLEDFPPRGICQGCQCRCVSHVLR